MFYKRRIYLELRRFCSLSPDHKRLATGSVGSMTRVAGDYAICQRDWFVRFGAQSCDS